jgi:hypothetical protein
VSVRLIRVSDKTHFITVSSAPTDSRIVLGSLWSKTSSNELYICTGLGPTVFTLLTGGSGAPTGSSYVTMANDGTLTDERVLTAGAGITITDGGAGSTVTIASTGSASPSFARPFLIAGC